MIRKITGFPSGSRAPNGALRYMLDLPPPGKRIKSKLGEPIPKDWEEDRDIEFEDVPKTEPKQ